MFMGTALRDGVGLREFADRLGYPFATVWQWRRSPGFPLAARTLGGSPVWEWIDLLSWAHATGRDERIRWFDRTG